MLYYELSISGKQYLETVSRYLVLNRSADPIQNKSLLSFSKYRKAAKEIKDIPIKWSEKMNEFVNEHKDTK